MPNGVGDREGWMDFGEQMNVIFDSTRREDRCIVFSRSAADVGEQVVSPVVMDERVAELCAEDDVDQKTVMSL